MTGDTLSFPARPVRLLVIGGYGAFGSRLVRLLAREGRLDILVGGRSLQKAASFCAGVAAQAHLLPVEIDRDHVTAARLRDLAVDLVVDAAGPFNRPDDGRYRVIEAALAARVHYCDLADKASFIAGVGAFDDAARRNGIFIISGLSSFPCLSSAVLAELSGGLPKVTRVTSGIAPSPRAGVGETVVRGMAQAAGQPLRVLQGGRHVTLFPGTQTWRTTIAAPGGTPLPNTLFALADAPDMALPHPANARDAVIRIGAGLRPALLQRIYVALSWLVRVKALPGVGGLTRAMVLARRLLPFGQHRGGMIVAVEGEDGRGTPMRRSWHLVAEGDDGPLVPVLGIVALVRRMMAGTPPANGARSAAGVLTLADYDAAFRGHAIAHGRREDSALAGESLYRRILGPAYNALPPSLRAMHEIGETTRLVEGRGSIERGAGLLARLAGRMAGFPPAMHDVPVRVTFTPRNGAEIWQRDFDGARFFSVQAEGRGRFERLVTERFGPMVFGLAITVRDGRLMLAITRWTLFGVPMPLWLAPRSDAMEYEEDGRFRFDVAISHPLAGTIVHYRGWLAPQVSTPSPQRAAMSLPDSPIE